MQDYASARALLASEDPYQPLQPLRERMQLPASERFKMKAEHNPHPPVAVLLTLPVAGLSFERAYLVTRIIQIVFLAVAWVWACWLAGLRGLHWPVAGGLALGLWPPVWGGLDWGQPIGLIAVLSVSLFHVAGTRRPVFGGLLMATACLVRPFFAAVAAAAGGWKARHIAVAGVVMIALAAGSFILVGVPPWEWFRRDFASKQFRGRGRIAFGRARPARRGSAGRVPDLGGVRCGVSATPAARRAKRPRSGLTGGLLWYPLAWFHYDIAFIPIALWAGSAALRQRYWSAVLMVAAYVALRFVPPYAGIAGSMTWIPVTGRAFLLGACGMLCIRPASRPPIVDCR